MVKIAAKLSEGIPAVRIDLYSVNNRIFFGEYTFFTNSGFDNDITKECDVILGDYLQLSQYQSENILGEILNL